MKQVNITAHIAPLTHTMRPARESWEKAPVPWRQASHAATVSTAKRLRHKVTSKPSADSKWRLTTPPRLQSRQHRIISRRARAWLIGRAV
jgi:hypothetical protein